MDSLFGILQRWVKSIVSAHPENGLIRLIISSEILLDSGAARLKLEFQQGAKIWDTGGEKRTAR